MFNTRDYKQQDSSTEESIASKIYLIQTVVSRLIEERLHLKPSYEIWYCATQEPRYVIVFRLNELPHLGHIEIYIPSTLKELQESILLGNLSRWIENNYRQAIAMAI